MYEAKNKETMKENLKSEDYREMFKVPEHYFEDFQLQMEKRIDDMQKASVLEKPQGIEVSFFQKAKPYLYMAAMFVVIFLVIQGIFRRQPSSVPSVARTEATDLYEDINDAQITAEDILMSSLDGYGLMYYLYVDSYDDAD